MHSIPQRLGRALPLEVEAMVVQDMEDLGVDPAFIYAFQHTGLLVTDATIAGYTDAELMAWQGALERYKRIRSSAA